MRRLFASALACFCVLALATGCSRDSPASETFLSVEAVSERIGQPGVVLVDGRDAEAFAAGHLPGAVNLPPSALRTTADHPAGKNLIFRRGDGGPENRQIDAERYAAIFGAAGIDADTEVIAYGDHAGKAEGSTVLMLLDLLGHRGKLRFLDGVGVDRWTKAGLALETGPGETPVATAYQAQPREGALWTAADVEAHLGHPDVVFWDTRSLEEFTGDNPRTNARGGHLPGARHLDYASLLDAAHGVKPARDVLAERAGAGVSAADLAGKTVVLYCQSATRVSLPYLLLREAGVEAMAVYDGSMQEWLNDEARAIATGPGA